MASVELDPAHLSAWDLRVYLAEERAGGWTPKHFVASSMPDAVEPVCQLHAGADPGEVYGFTTDRGIFDRWHAVGWGCQACAEVLHS